MEGLRLLLLVMITSVASAGPREVAATVDAVIEGAKTHYREVSKLFPASLGAEDYEGIARLLMLDKLDLEELGDAGVTFKDSAISHSLRKLAELPGGDRSLIRLMEDKDLLIDGARALTLCDAIVRRGKEMLPLLAAVSARPDLAQRCGDHIRNGSLTAF